MHIFLTWHSKRNTYDNEKVADKIGKGIVSRYQKHIKQKLYEYVYSNKRTGLVYVSERSLSQNTYFLQKNKKSICFAAGTPTGLDRLFSEYNIESHMSNYLLTLKELFNKNGFDLIKRISPPFIFGFIENDGVRIVHDGLGFEQGFIYEDDDYWICSNKCWPIISLSGKKFKLDDVGWKQYFDINFFPLKYTPFKQIFALDSGEIWSCRNGKVVNEQIDCFTDWLKPLNKSKEEILEIARKSFNGSVRELIHRYSHGQAVADLSGGKDSRAILSSILNQNLDCVFGTAGDKWSADVKVVKLINKEIPIKIMYSNHSLENIVKDQLNAKINKFIEWQDGLGDMKLCKYMSTDPKDNSCNPILSGSVGGVYRAEGYPKNKLWEYLRKSIKWFLKTIKQRKSPILNSTDKIEDVKKLVFEEGRKYGLTGNSLRDHYNFSANRWGGANAAVPYAGYLLPFLNIGMIQALFSLTEDDRKAEIVHKHITTYNLKALAKIPYDNELISNDKMLTKTPYDDDVFWRNGAGRATIEKILNEDHYIWNTLLNKKEVKKIFKDHCSGKARHGDFLWRVVAFYFWYEKFSTSLSN